MLTIWKDCRLWIYRIQTLKGVDIEKRVNHHEKYTRGSYLFPRLGGESMITIEKVSEVGKVVYDRSKPDIAIQKKFDDYMRAACVKHGIDPEKLKKGGKHG